MLAMTTAQSPFMSVNIRSTRIEHVTKERMRLAIIASFRCLLSQDANLFTIPYGNTQRERELHEICINHALARHLEEQICAILPRKEKVFVDIEFNKRGVKPKVVRKAGQTLTIRPDIIIHDRKATAKCNLLVVECKKKGAYATPRRIAKDKFKIKALMEDTDYSYRFGLQIIYSLKRVTGTFYFRQQDSNFSEEPISYT